MQKPLRRFLFLANFTFSLLFLLGRWHHFDCDPPTHGITTKPFSAVLPTTFASVHLLDIFFHTCTPVLTPDAFAEVLIVVPGNEITNFSTRYDGCMPGNWKFISEDEIVPEYAVHGKGGSGWLLQQDIKFAAYRYVSQDYYIALDADVFCTGKRVEPDEFFVNNRITTCMEYVGQGSRFFGKKNLVNTIFATAPLLDNMDISEYQYTMGWTPQPMSRELLKIVGSQFSSTHENESLIDFLLNHGRPRAACISEKSEDECKHVVWTEYFAYFMLAKQSNLWDIFHHEVMTPGIEMGTCFSEKSLPLKIFSSCWKVRVECAEDFSKLLQMPYESLVPFGVLNDHQLKAEEVEAILLHLRNADMISSACIINTHI